MDHRIAGGPHHDADGPRGPLRVRQEQLRDGRLTRIALQDVADDANHFNARAVDVDESTDRIVAAKPAASSSLVDHRDTRRLGGIVRGERAAALHGGADRAEVARADARDGDFGVDVRRRRGRAIDGEPEHRAATAERQDGADARAGDPWQRAQPCLDVVHTRTELGRVGVPGTLHRDPERHRLIGTESRRHLRHRDKTPNQETRAGQQHDRQRHLDDDQRAADAVL